MLIDNANNLMFSRWIFTYLLINAKYSWDWCSLVLKVYGQVLDKVKLGWLCEKEEQSHPEGDMKV